MKYSALFSFHNVIIKGIKINGATIATIEAEQLKFEVESIRLHKISRNVGIIQQQSEWNHSISAYEKVHFTDGSPLFQYVKFDEKSRKECVSKVRVVTSGDKKRWKSLSEIEKKHTKPSLCLYWGDECKQAIDLL